MSKEHGNEEMIGPDSPHFSTEGDEAGMPAWTEIDEGRFMPRRVRGSYHGRALG